MDHSKLGQLDQSKLLGISFRMPTKYRRKLSSQRGAWSEDNLRNAIEAIDTKTMGVNAAAKHFNVPKATLLRRKASGKLQKTGSLGPSSTFGEANEAKLVAHIKKIQKFGFALTRNDVRHMAFALAEQLNLKNRFNATTKMAGYDWLHLFLNRHADLSIRVAEGVSINRSKALCRETVTNYFELLETVLQENQLFDKPSNIFNVDETGLQLNNRPGQVVAAKGSRAVTSITSGEKGETISVIACCNGEGSFLPPYCIFKGKNLKAEFSSGMPPGSVVRMSQKSAYVNTDIFFAWLKDHFMPRKPLGKVLLILDGHTSHCNLCEMLEFAEENGIIMLCLPPHTTHYLQPLDRAVFKSLKTHYYAACNNFMKTNPGRKIGRLQFGQLLAEAWAKAAIPKNAVSGFRATGIIPFSMEAIPEYAFLSDDGNGINQQPPNANHNEVANNNNNNAEGNEKLIASDASSVEVKDTDQKLSDGKRKRDTTHISTKDKTTPYPRDDAADQPQQGCSHWESPLTNESDCQNQQDENVTPGKLLDLISPVPKSNEKVSIVKKRGRALAQVLTSPENIAIKKALKRNVNNKKVKQSVEKTKVANKTTKKKLNKGKVTLSSTSESEGELSLQDYSDTLEDWDENDCVACGENYNETQKTDDWVQCIICTRWLHESCVVFQNMCNKCGKKNT